MTVSELDSMYKGTQIGDTTRSMTNAYLQIKSTNEYVPYVIGEIIFEDRMALYKSQGVNVSDDLIEDVFRIANGYFPFMIFADIFVANCNNKMNNLDTMLATLVIILKVIVDEYNILVSEGEQIIDNDELYLKVRRFIKSETGIDIFAEDDSGA